MRPDCWTSSARTLSWCPRCRGWRPGGASPSAPARASSATPRRPASSPTRASRPPPPRPRAPPPGCPPTSVTATTTLAATRATPAPSLHHRYGDISIYCPCNVCGCNVHLRHILFCPRQFQCQSGTIRSCSLALVKHNPFHFIFTLHQKRPSIILIGMWSVISND